MKTSINKGWNLYKLQYCAVKLANTNDVWQVPFNISIR